MQDWLPIVAALIGALATFGVWAYVSRQRLLTKNAELERSLENRTTELESARIQLQRLSTEDHLTAVANHEQFLEFLEREWRRSRRDGLPLTLIFIDVDHFRAYNREFGRKAGDEVLKHVGRALAGVVG
ncbi:MAG TPA: diguanylate cyclase, partial [Vicinamibacterales bacterium]|nr:diguanylate cyclase [Vicinamibacterales bacterium]